MSFGQFIHVSQFYETILCFSILILIGQRMVMLCRDLDDKYLRARASQFDDQIDWEKSFTTQRQILVKQRQQEQREEEQRKREQQKRQRQRQQREEKEKSSNPPKQENLRSSLVQNEYDQTDRQLNSSMQEPERLSAERKSSDRKSSERKSLSQLRKSNERKDSKQFQIKDEQQQPKQDRRASRSSRNDSKDEQTPKRNSRLSKDSQKDQNDQERMKTINLDQEELQKVGIDQRKSKDQADINPHQEETEQDRLEKQYKDKTRIRYLIRIDAIFNEYLPILLSALIVGMIGHSTYIFTMVCFFGYMFTSLLFNYANLLSKLKNEPTQTSIFSRVNKLISGLFIIGLFISYWFDVEYG